jgi:hypothetical protein
LVKSSAENNSAVIVRSAALKPQAPKHLNGEKVG